MELIYSDLQRQAISLLTVGKYKESSAIFSECLESNPENIINYAYLGIIDLLQGDLESAEMTWMSIFLDKEPEIVEILSQSLIKIFDKQASLFLEIESEEANKKAQIIYQKLIEVEPDFPDSYLGLGILAMRQENYAQAIANFTKFIDLDNTFARAYHLRGVCYYKKDSFTLAISDLENAIKLNNLSFSSYECLKDCLLAENQIEKALALAENIIAKYPNYAEGYIYLGDCFANQDNLSQCLVNYNQALEINSYLSSVYHKLTVILSPDNNNDIECKFTLDDYKIIISILDKSLERKVIDVSKICAEIIGKTPEYAIKSYEYLIQIAILENRLEDAIKIAYQGISKYPNAISLYYELAYWLETKNQLSEANNIIKQAITVNSDDLQINFLAAKIAYRRGEKQSAIESLIKLSQTKVNSPEEEKTMGILLHELGFILDQEKCYQEAFECFCSAKITKKVEDSNQEEERKKMMDYFEYVEGLCQPNWHKTWRDQDLIYSQYQGGNSLLENNHFQPAMLVGFSRSGTTLLGKILDNHSQIQSLDEQRGIVAVRGYINSLISRQTHSSYLAENNPRIEELKRIINESFKSIKQLREIYFNTMINQLGENANLTKESDFVLLDKNPFHLVEVPVIHRILPDAKFICLIRHPFDVCISSFMQSFNINPMTANFSSLEQTAHCYRQVMNLWLKSTSVLPVKVLTVFYENLVEDFAGTIKEVLDFLELPWDDSVLNYYQNSSSQKLISTPSYRQVSQPIYKSAKYRWHNYQKQIEQILPILQPFIERWGY